MSEDRKEQLRDLEVRLGYRFRDLALLDRALTHRSYVHTSSLDSLGNPSDDYESLEFLGDAVLELITSELLFRRFPELPEGDLTRIRSFLVSAGSLHELARGLELGDSVRLSKGEERSGGRFKKAILADVYESVAAAIYLDGGLAAARGFVLACLDQRIDELEKNPLRDFRDYKSRLQEELHRLGRPTPIYRTISEEGPDHEKEFVVEVSVDGGQLASARGRSKKEAHQRAAGRALEHLCSVPDDEPENEQSDDVE